MQTLYCLNTVKDPKIKHLLNQHEQIPMNSRRLWQWAQGSYGSGPGPLCIYCGFQFSVFYGISEFVNK